MAEKDYQFEALQSDDLAVPVTRVTPDDGFYAFTYFDVCPFSPSQRYLATTRLPFQDRIPRLGETADVCIIDLQAQSIRTVYTTKSWGFQTGANLQWGATDRRLYANDVIDGQAVCVQVDLETGEVTPFSGPMYHIAPDESCVIGSPLELLNVTQQGYGCPSEDPDNPARLPPGAAKDQGLWCTDLKTNERTLLVSLADVAACLPESPPAEGGTFYFWHSKFNKQGTRIMQILRCLLPDGSGGRNPIVFTLNPDGSDIRCTPFRPVWGAKGGHPNWHPDGRHVIRCASMGGKAMRYCQARYDGDEPSALSDTLSGGGHPSIEPTGRYIITDAFPDKQTVALRLADLTADCERDVCLLPTIDRSRISNAALRLDGHPVWSRDYRRVCFQAARNGARQLFIADLSEALST
jgi:hypothetical protein